MADKENSQYALDDNNLLQFVITEEGILAAYTLRLKKVRETLEPSEINSEIISYDKTFSKYGEKAIEDALEYGSTSIYWWNKE